MLTAVSPGNKVRDRKGPLLYLDGNSSYRKMFLINVRSSVFHERAGNNPLMPLAINSIDIAARINPIIRVKTFMPV